MVPQYILRTRRPPTSHNLRPNCWAERWLVGQHLCWASAAGSCQSSQCTRGRWSIWDIVKLTIYPVSLSVEQGEESIHPILQLRSENHGVMHRPLTTLIPVPKLAVPEAKFEIEAVALNSDLAVVNRCNEARLDTVVLETKPRIGDRRRTFQRTFNMGNFRAKHYPTYKIDSFSFTSSLLPGHP